MYQPVNECPWYTSHMDTLMKADIFFFISSISSIVFLILGCVALYYLIRVLKNVKEATDTLKSKIETAGDEVRELVEDVRESSLFRFFFGKKKRKK
jgi:membrane protein implicated in regulation of membrane protease activity